MLTALSMNPAPSRSVLVLSQRRTLGVIARPAHIAACFGACLAACAGTGTALAQASKPAAPDQMVAVGGSRNEPGTENAGWSIAEQAGRSVARLALLDLRLSPDPGPREYKIAAILNRLAQQYLPNDADLIRRQIESEWNAEDSDAAIEATQRLLRIDPRDTVAQLRLVSHRIGAMQTTEERLAAYERFLSDAGKGLDPSIRSRLALDCALLHRERGDEEKFVSRLKLATALDGTNKEAALLAYTYFAESVQDAKGRAELLLNMLYADPLDSSVYFRLADQLASGGAFTGASRMYRMGERVLIGAGSALTGEQELKKVMLSWHVSGPKAVREELEKTLAGERFSAQQMADRQKVMNVPGEEIVDPMALRLPRSAEQMRCLASFGEGNQAAVLQSLSDLTLTVDRMKTDVADPEKLPKEMKLEEAQGIARDAQVDLTLLRAFTGQQLDKIESGLENLIIPLEANDIRPTLIRAIMIANQGNHAEAIGQFRELINAQDTPSPDGVVIATTMARLSLGKSLTATGGAAEAGDIYRDIIRETPLSAMGAMAATLLDQMRGKKEAIFAYSDALEKLAADVPRWVEEIISQPRTFVGLISTPVMTSQDPLAPLRVRVSMRNLSGVPMGVGSSRPLNSRILFTCNLDTKGIDTSKHAKPEVIDIDHRLRLLPGESIEATVWADPGYAGWFSENVSTGVVRAKYRLVQGFVSTRRGIIDPGPGCVQADLPVVVRTTLRETTLTAAEIAAEVANANENSVARLAAAARALVIGEPLATRKLTEDDKTLIARAFAARYPSLSAPIRAILLVTLPHAGQSRPFADFDKAAVLEQDASLVPLAIATRVSDAAHPLLQTAKGSSDATVKLFATLHAERLESKSACFATAGPSTPASFLPEPVSEAAK
ncbi:MAG TPA: tetratricopeptide repeat protein [Phycisphaerales bacterium]